MTARPSDNEIARRIEALLRTSRAGQAVADCLEQQTLDWSHRAAVGDLRARRVEHCARAALGGVARGAMAELRTKARLN
jgi:hypothetical protein